MRREQALVKNTIILSIGTFLPKIVSMITLPLLTAYLTTTEYGTYDLITTLVSLLLPAVTLQIQSAAFRFLIKTRNNLEDSKIIVTNILGFTIPISLISLVVLFFSLHKIEVSMRIIISFYFFMDVLLVTIRQITRGIGDNLNYTIDSITNSLVMLILTVIGVLSMHNRLLGVLLALTGSSIWSLLFLSFKIRINKYIDANVLSWMEIKVLLAYSWPMVPNNLSGWILSLSDRLVITYFIGIEANAIYAVANKIPNLLKAFQSTFTFAWQENASLSVDDKDSNKYYSKMFEGITCLLVGGIACLIAVTPILFPILIRGNYDKAYYQIPILYLATFFSVISGVLGGIYIAHMKTKSVGVTTIVAAVCNLLIDLMFVKSIGIYAGSISTLVSYLLLTLYRMYDVRNIQPMTYNYKKMILGTLCLVTMAFFFYKRILILNIINLIIAIIVTYLLNRNLIKGLLKKVLLKIC